MRLHSKSGIKIKKIMFICSVIFCNRCKRTIKSVFVKLPLLRIFFLNVGMSCLCGTSKHIQLGFSKSNHFNLQTEIFLKNMVELGISFTT